MTDFDEMLERVKSLTGLEGRDAAKVAFELDDNPRPQEIVDKAIELGFDVERKHGQESVAAATPIAEMTMNPAEVLSEVYMVMPRVLCSNMPKMGRAPDEVNRHEQLAGLLAELPEDIQAMLIKVDLIEGSATFWIRDEANDIDRPLGPVDLTRFTSERALEEAFQTLLKRMNKVLAADFN